MKLKRKQNYAHSVHNPRICETSRSYVQSFALLEGLFGSWMRYMPFSIPEMSRK